MLPPIVAPTIILLAALSIASNTAAVAHQDKAEQSVQPLEEDPDAMRSIPFSCQPKIRP
jgi:hypothetical protein